MVFVWVGNKEFGTFGCDIEQEMNIAHFLIVRNVFCVFNSANYFTFTLCFFTEKW